MSTWGPGGKERFQHDLSGALPPLVGVKQFIHLEAEAPPCYYFMARALATAEWPKPLLGRFMVCPSLWSPFYSWCLFMSGTFICLVSPWLCLPGEGIPGIVLAQRPTVTPDLWGLQEHTELCD